MRIVVVADIHGNLPALEAVVRDFTRRGYDAVVNLGVSAAGDCGRRNCDFDVRWKRCYHEQLLVVAPVCAVMDGMRLAVCGVARTL
jgi:hypothetical protein